MNSQKAPLTPFLLAMIILSTILSIRNWPFLVEYGFSSLVYLLAAVCAFFIPISLVSAELASGWPHQGGIYVWVKEALGKKGAFLSIWFLWISNVVWYPLVLTFISTTILYSFAPELAKQPLYVIPVMLTIYWGVLLSNLFGIRYSGWFGTVTFLLGTLLPGLALIVFGAIWIFSGHTSHIDFSLNALIPRQVHLNEIIFLVSMVLCFAGMEMNAIHAKDVQNPSKNFPKMIFLSAFIIVVMMMLGIFSIGIALPKENVNLTTAVMDTISFYLKGFHLEGYLVVFSCIIAFGALGAMSSWIVGTSKGLLFASEQNHLPPFLSKLNRYDVPTNLMLLQGAIVSLLIFMFVAMPSLSSAFWILTALSSQLYLITYVLMFVSAILLRLKKPDVPREYTVPGGNKGLFLISGLGIATCVFAFFIGLIPPAQLKVGSIVFYEFFLILSIALCTLVPFLFLRRQKRAPVLLEEPKS